MSSQYGLYPTTKDKMNYTCIKKKLRYQEHNKKNLHEKIGGKKL